jgi:flagella basal body P-ring formation protein FlgA
MSIDPKDTNLLNLSEPTFHFELEPQRLRDLGRVSWDVSILTGKSTQKVTVSGEARAWEQQIIVAKPASAGQLLRDEDISERRALVDHVDDDAVLTRSQVVGQLAARDLRPGTVMTARLVKSVPLAQVGQYISVKLTQGGIEVQTVAKALETGGYGESIRVKNEQSNEIFTVTLTGPQTGVMGPMK